MKRSRRMNDDRLKERIEGQHSKITSSAYYKEEEGVLGKGDFRSSMLCLPFF
jgi:hypothetical protein